MVWLPVVYDCPYNNLERTLFGRHLVERERVVRAAALGKDFN